MELSREYIVGTDDDVASVHESIKKWIRVNQLKEDREYIVGTDDDVASVHESIKKWIRVNQLKEEAFLVEATMIPENLPSDDLLGRLVGALTQDELRRMSIPLDVVGKLRRRAI